MLRYFSATEFVTPIEEIKAEYRRLALKYHPDCGGSEADFVAMQAEYEWLLRANREAPQPQTEPEVSEINFGEFVKFCNCATPGRRGAVYSFVFVDLAEDAPLDAAPTVVVEFIGEMPNRSFALSWVRLHHLSPMGVLVKHDDGSSAARKIGRELAKEIKRQTGRQVRCAA